MNKIIMGGQWGDEGKGKIVDLISKNVNVVARYQGGANAGHTVYSNGKKLVLHQVPSGILQDNCICVLGNGMVIDPVELCLEIKELEELNFSTSNIYISPNAHIVTPLHKAIDVKNEDSAKNKIGTTGKGIGPTYVDKYNRKGIRAIDLLDVDKLKNQLEKRLGIAQEKNEVAKNLTYDNEAFTVFYNSCKYISKYIKNIFPIMHDQNSKILVEGAQGALLDIDHGTYPYVTSSNPTIGGISSGLGIPATKFSEIIGIFKAYVTRVGNGPFPTELFDKTGETIQDVGKEFGATTGRPRRCGWFDSVAANYSVKLNGINQIVLTKLDILSEFDTIKVCTAYKNDESESNDYSEFMNKLDKVKPIYREFEGWNCDISSINSYNDLPTNAKEYIEYIQNILDTKIAIISVGPKRNQVIEL
tara:strand:+ start:1194 stop:2444 length:1251 start_codon:yes stop_codon:yes gene_type:complete